MERHDYSEIQFATPEIAESWKRSPEQEAIEKRRRPKRPLTMLMLIWMEIDDHPGISWRQLCGTFTKHSLSAGLKFLVGRNLVLRVEGGSSCRGRKPVRYFPSCPLFIPYPARTVRSKYGKTHFFGTWVMRKSNRAEQSVIIKDPSSKEAFPFKKVVRKPPPKRFVRLFPEEKKEFDDYMAWIEEKRSKELAEGKTSKSISNT